MSTNTIMDTSISPNEYPIIDKLDVSEGVKNCGSYPLFMNLLGDFYKLIDIKSNRIEELLNTNNIREYVVEVHNLKNTTRMIGALELSSMFYTLELAGKANDLKTINELNTNTLNYLRSYKLILEPYRTNNSITKKAVPFKLIKKHTIYLHDAVDNFDLDEADKYMRLLETYIVPEKIERLINSLSSYLADVAMEKVLSISEELITILDGMEDRRATIMLVDDDEISSKAVATILQDEFYVMTATSGDQLFMQLHEYLPHLVLLDVQLPEMDGHAIIQILKSNPLYADIPVIFLTSDEEESDEIQGLTEGAIDYIKKPFRKNVATQRIRRILELSYLQNHLKSEVARQTAVAEERRMRVERMSLQMVQTLANTIDAKDPYTNGHSMRVAKYSVMIAKRMGYTNESLEQVQYAALLHDIGKIGIPEAIINKTSKLTDEEYELIKTHPTIGGNILSEITEIPDIAIGARWHHERYDGKGYPDSLANTDIPEIARIIGVADTYDAMTSKRSYRDVLPQGVVRAEIEKGKHTQFDPEIADIMIQIIDEDKEYILHE